MGGNMVYKLSPSTLDKNDIEVYIDYFDIVFSDDEIKNIALTGKYGAGKSSVWNSYLHHKQKGFHHFGPFNKKRIISISLPCFSSESQNSDITESVSLENSKSLQNNDNQNKSHGFHHKKISKNNADEVEIQILNQILYQVNLKKTPLSKYRIKRKFGFFDLLNIVFYISLTSVGILALLFSREISNEFSKLNVTYYENSIRLIGGILLVFVYSILSYKIIPIVDFKLLKFSFKGAEAFFNEETSSNVLNDEIKEIVYIIKSSKISTIVFEDIDRYENIDLFSKLRRLNYLLNVNSKNIVRFVYIIKDGLFDATSRSKFFDIIIPIVPFLNKQNSFSILKNVFNDLKSDIVPSNNFLDDVSNYIEDMRAIYSIRNEYEIYSRHLKSNERKLKNDQLCSLIVIKNNYPAEFEKIQNHEGYLFRLFDLSDKRKIVLRKEIKERIISITQQIEELKLSGIEKYAESLTLKIPNTISINEGGSDWVSFIKDWYNNQDRKINIRNKSSIQPLNFEEFLNLLVKNYYIQLPSSPKSDEVLENDILNLKYQISNLNQELNELHLYNVRRFINEKTNDEIIELVRGVDFSDFNVKYYLFLRFLIINGYLDENCSYYLGSFNGQNSPSNNELFLRGLKEGVTYSEDLELDSIEEIVKKLHHEDFDRDGLFNKSLLIELLNKQDCSKPVWKIISKTYAGHKKDSLMTFFNTLNINLLKNLVKHLITNDFNLLQSIIFSSSKISDLSFKLTFIVYENYDLVQESSRKLSEFTSKSSKILNYNDFITKPFLEGLKKGGIEFHDISNIDISKDFALEIEELGLFKISVPNVSKISSILTPNNYEENGSRILDDLILSDYLKMSLSKVEMELFINQFLDYLENNTYLIYLSEKSFLIILNDYQITTETLNRLLKKKPTQITSLDSVKKNELWNPLLESNLVLPIRNNLDLYFSVFNISSEFVSFINSNSNTIIENELNSDIINKLILRNNTSDTIFERITNNLKDGNLTLTEELSKYKLEILVKNNMLSLNRENLEYILSIESIRILSKYIKNHRNNFFDYLERNKLIKLLNSSQIENIVNLKLINENDVIKLLNISEAKVSLLKIPRASIKVKNFILKNKLNLDDIQSIVSLSYDIDFWRDFAETLFENDTYYNEALNHQWSEVFISQVLILDIELVRKIDFICDSISKKCGLFVIIRFLKMNELFNNFSNVFKGKRPIIINTDESSVANAFMKIGVISISKESTNSIRIRLRKKQLSKYIKSSDYEIN